MQFRLLSAAATLTALLFFVGMAESQPPPGGPQDKGGKKDGDGFGKKDGKKDGKGKGKGKGGNGSSEDDLVAHLLSFDKGNTGKVSKEQLPERIQSYVDQGDSNKDGFLDREEIVALSAKFAQQPPDGFGKGKGKGGKGKGKGKGFEDGGPGDFDPFGDKGFGKKGPKGKGEFGDKGFGKGDFDPFDDKGFGKKGPKGKKGFGDGE